MLVSGIAAVVKRMYRWGDVLSSLMHFKTATSTLSIPNHLNMELQDREPSVLIIGAGIFGTSTAYQLAKTYNNPSNITIIDRTSSPPDPAASTDINKIIRADYSSPFYCNLAYEALHAWAVWPELKPFYHQVSISPSVEAQTFAEPYAFFY